MGKNRSLTNCWEKLDIHVQNNKSGPLLAEHMQKLIQKTDSDLNTD